MSDVWASRSKKNKAETYDTHCSACSAVTPHYQSGGCKPCVLKRVPRALPEQSPATLREYSKVAREEWRSLYNKILKAQNYAKYRARDFVNAERHRSGLELDRVAVQAAIEASDGKCEACGEHFGVKRLAVDHCHVSGAIRGMLCTSCNTKEGILSVIAENLGLLKYMVRYGSRPAEALLALKGEK